MNPHSNQEVILATEVGVWATTNFQSASPNWIASNTGLANVRVDMLKHRSSDGVIIAATHGRGLFSSVFDLACPAPSALTATSITKTTASLGWTEVGTATTWDIEWGARGFTSTGTPTITGTTTNPHNLTGLTGTTTYDFYVRANCGGGDLSTWSGPYSFTTPCSILVVPVAVCSTNTTSTNNAGILNVELNGVSSSSSSSHSDGGNIDKSANCSNYFEIDISVSNTLNVSMFSVNYQQLGVWIDWNDDGDFEDDAEQQYLQNDIVAATTVPIILTYPASIPYGDYVRIRLITDLDERYGGGIGLINSACYSSLIYGQSEDYAIYVQPATNWTGTVNTDWTTPGNWATVAVPTASDDVVISSVPVNQPVIGATTGASVNNLTVAAGASLSVTSGGSLIVNGTSTGNITYNVAIVDTNWHLVSSPVIGEQYNDAWVTANSIAISGTGNRGISTYNNGTPHATTKHWRYFTGGTTENFVSGIGYANLRTAAGNYSFTGTFPTADIVSTISQNDQNWNLIGNPYPSYIDIDAFITANTANLSGAFQAVYVWDGVSYANLTTGYIQPGQGFFVNSNISSGSASIAKAMQSHQTGVTFYKTATPSIKVTLSDGTSSKETQINYLDDQTTGLDPRFDIGLFDGTSSNLRIYTHLLIDNEGIAFQRQALPNSDLESMIVPVGLKAAAGKEISFSLKAVNLPTNINVFLEDKVANTITRLDEENTAYSVTLSEALNGVGRFFLHTSSQILEVSNLDLASVSIYSLDKKIHLSGLPNGLSKITLYNVLAKVVLKESTTKNTTSISVENLSKGSVYIVKLITEKGVMGKKIIIE
jgi:hypothetical protein